MFRISREKESYEEEKLDLISQIKTAENNLAKITSAPEKTSFSEEDMARISKLEEEIASLNERR